MRNTILSLVLIISTLNAVAQPDSLQAPYRRFPTPPPFKLLLADSTTIFTKENLSAKKPLLVVVFSPDCEHCKHETEAILQHIDQFKHIQIVMATMLPYEKMKEFYDHYELGKHKNIIVGKDLNYMLPPFYNMHTLPYLAFYDKKGKLINTFEGSMPIEDLIKVFNP